MCEGGGGGGGLEGGYEIPFQCVSDSSEPVWPSGKALGW